MTLAKRYTPESVEDKWYAHWMEKNYFHSEPDERTPYSIVIPPPNVTGVLHMGHMLNNTIQDILIRKARLEGKNACWVPGTDHASIATEAKVVRMLRERGIRKGDIDRDEFLKYAWEWKEKYGGIILEQLKKLGASCDWERTRFTMEDSLSKAVIKVFVDLHKKGKIYRGLRMTNWDPEAQTALSNEEVIYKEEDSNLYHVRYKVKGTEDEWVTIATTRPETILGDTAIAVHPEDERYTHLKGKQVVVPLIGRVVPVIFDTYVEREFGTGALKITPAHDLNDYEIGQRHGLETVDILNADGTLSEAAQLFIGKDRFEVRKLIVPELEAAGHLVKKEAYKNKVGTSERTGVVIEPRLTKQWFLDMKDFGSTALKAVRSGEVQFFPEHFWNMYYNWLNEDNIRDWCISRQLWWGQRIPAFYYGEEVVVAETPEEAVEIARERFGNPDITIQDLHQDEDVVDTWFSSWLWPISVFDGFEKQDELRYYYPTNVLVTGWDIMFFWVARMIMAGYEWSGDLLGEEIAQKKGIHPFRDVYFTGMVRDNKRRKMSKSLGNSPDALALIEKYGADGVRFGMLSSGSAGNDIIFDAPFDEKARQVLNESKLCEQGLNFCNKMWNALRLLKGWKIEEGEGSQVNKLAVNWFEHKLNEVISDINRAYETYRLSDIIKTLYSFIWDDFCSWYLEMIKPEYGKPIDRKTYEKTIVFFEKLMVVLHPFMPFVTEEVWHQLRDRKEGEDCVISAYPRAEEFDLELIKNVEGGKDVITKIRDTRNNTGSGMKEQLPLFVQETDKAKTILKLQGLKDMIIKLGNLSDCSFTTKEEDNWVSFVSGTEKYYLEVKQTIDVAAESERIKKELDYAKGFVASVKKKLDNERFVNNAPAMVVNNERKKLEDGLKKIKILEEGLSKLEGVK